MELNKNAASEEIAGYIDALRQSGISYVELDFDVFKRLPPDINTDNLIFRMKSKDEFYLTAAYNFPFVVVPPELFSLTKRMNCPIIIEIDQFTVETNGLLDAYSKAVDFDKVSIIRFVYDFGDDNGKIENMVNRGRDKRMFSVDICPLNNSLCAVSSAISAFRAHSELLTVRFGSEDTYANYESYLAALSQLYNYPIKEEYFVGLCKASIMYQCICNKNTVQLDRAMNHFQLVPQLVKEIDEQVPTIILDMRERKFIKKMAMQRAEPPTRESLIRKQLSNFRVDGETTQVLEGIIADCNMTLYNNNENN